MKIVSFTAPKGAGKDTAADILIEAKKAEGKISFAGPLKEICSEVFEVPMRLFNDVDLKEKPFAEVITLSTRNLRGVKNKCIDFLDPYKYAYNANKATTNGLEHLPISTPRQLLQIIGTEFIRDRIDTDWHIKCALSEERLEKLKDGVYCVTDARFINEYLYLVNKFGVAGAATYYVERPEAEKRLAEATHDSELGVLEIRKHLNDTQILKNDKGTKEFKELLLKLEWPKDEPSSKTKQVGKFKFGSRQ